MAGSPEQFADIVRDHIASLVDMVVDIPDLAEALDARRVLSTAERVAAIIDNATYEWEMFWTDWDDDGIYNVGVRYVRRFGGLAQGDLIDASNSYSGVMLFPDGSGFWYAGDSCGFIHNGIPGQQDHGFLAERGEIPFPWAGCLNEIRKLYLWRKCGENQASGRATSCICGDH